MDSISVNYEPSKFINLKLPPAVITELSAAKDSAVGAFFTERRLRSMTRLTSAQEQLEASRTM
jgi:hypothetical protein